MSLDVASNDALKGNSGGLSVSLNATTDTEGSAAQSPSMRLIAQVAVAKSRWQAVQSIVRTLSDCFPGASIRAGVGHFEMRHFFDAELGWVGGESRHHRDAVADWENHHDLTVGCQTFADKFVLTLPDRQGDGRCVVWVHSSQLAANDWLAETANTLSIIFWQRPKNDWSRWFRKLGMGSTFWFSIVVCSLLLVAIWPIEYPVACTATVQPSRQRIVAAPFEATLLATHFKPGETVQQGDQLVEFDGRPLRLELEAVEAEMQQVAKRRDVELATGKIADSQQSKLKHRQLSRERDLIKSRLAQLSIASPVTGAVISGELDQYIGSPLTTGQTMVEVAPLDEMVIEIEIPDHEIDLVAVGNEAKLRINGVAGQAIRTPIDTIYPSAEIRDDRNIFVARLRIDNPDLTLRPGMKGKATIYGPRRPLVWSWVRGLYERMLWSIGY